MMLRSCVLRLSVIPLSVAAEGGLLEVLLPSKISSTGLLDRVACWLSEVCRYGESMGSASLDTELVDIGVVLRLFERRAASFVCWVFVTFIFWGAGVGISVVVVWCRYGVLLLCAVEPVCLFAC